MTGCSDILPLVGDHERLLVGIEVGQRGIEYKEQINPINIRDIRHAAGSLEQKAAASGLHIENVTDPSIQLIAENFIELTNKLNPAIPAADKNLAYEVKVNYLVCEVNNLKTEDDKLKNQSA